MALPTAATPGYVAYPGVLYGPDVACSCLSRWLYLFRKLCVAKGYGDPVVWQLTGGNEKSGGTHSQGGTYDIAGINYNRTMLAREAGAVEWGRNWTGNVHSHGIIDCPHNDPAAYQRTACIVWRRDGLGYLGRQGPDPYPAPSKWRTYAEGIDWMKAELARLNAAPEDEMNADQEKKLDYAITQNKDIASRINTLAAAFKAFVTAETADDAAKGAALAKLQAMVDNVDEATWAAPIRRGDGTVPAIQELADAKSSTLRVEALLDPDALAAKIAAAMPQGATVTRPDLEAALRSVLGSLDGP